MCHVVVLQAGVKFQSPHDGSEMVLTPEHSVEIQNTIGETISCMVLFPKQLFDKVPCPMIEHGHIH